jgi:hypothetical protein
MLLVILVQSYRSRFDQCYIRSLVAAVAYCAASVVKPTFDLLTCARIDGGTKDLYLLKVVHTTHYTHHTLYSPHTVLTTPCTHHTMYLPYTVLTIHCTHYALYTHHTLYSPYTVLVIHCTY